ncbi:MAG TPA: peroxiredoxin-like family protein [Trebonia sp.]|nr:peroxiredoxin-like family protein [Trebonia sp.]
MRRFPRWYGACPLHLLTMVGCFALAGYAAAELLPNNAVGILVWLAGAVIGHDLILMPLYTLADRSAMAVFSHRKPRLPAVPWINYLRVPAALSGLLLLIWFPLIFRLPSRFPDTTTLSLDPYLWHWLAVTGALFLLSATALALRLGAVRRGTRKGRMPGRGVADPPSGATSGHPEPREPARHDGQADAGKTSPGRDAYVLKGVAPPTPRDPTTASRRSPGMTSPSTITERVAEMHAAMAADPPSEAMGAFAREQAGLAASGPAGIAPAGTVLPDAKLLDVHGADTTLYAEAGGGTSVLVFYRGAWCPYCNIALSAYQDQLLPQLTERGIRLVAISPQKPDGSLTMQQKHDLAFTVVSDPGNTIAGRLGILTQPSDEARAAQLQLGLDLTRVNADGTVALPMPATVILDASHTVRWIDVHPDYSTRTEPRQVIGALDQIAH